MTRLTQEHITQFQRDGFLKIESMVDDAQVEKLRQRVDHFLCGDIDERIMTQIEPAFDTEDAGGAERPPLRKFQCVSRYDDVFAAYLRTPEVSGVLSSVLGDSFVAYSDIVFMKPPEVGSRQPYHQDRVLGYDINDEARMVGLWLALDPATEANGCLRFIPGSHKKRLTGDEAAVIEQEALGPGIDTEAIVEAGVGDALLY